MYPYGMEIDPRLMPLKGGLIVSCQPDADDALHDPMNHAMIMAALAQSAVLGGAAGIRADGPQHTAAIRAVLQVPIIAIFKHDLPGFAVRITPTVADAVAVAQAGADFIAVDGTARPRPECESAADFIRQVILATGLPVMADISTYEEGLAAAQAGACAVLTTLSGYAAGSPQQTGPDFELLTRLVQSVGVPVIAEGRYATPAQAAQAMQAGAWAVTVGSAITRPKTITRTFVKAIQAC